MKPQLSYTIWFSQRTGSTLLCKALESTGVAGKPDEWLYVESTYNLYNKYNVKTPEQLQNKLWDIASTSNGVLGLKLSSYEPLMSKMVETFRSFPGCKDSFNRPEVWENAFPHHKHLWMTRRNKIRLAVSWWKAIKTGEWHLQTCEEKKQINVKDDYLYDALNHLFNEANLREALAQKFFDEAEIIPYTIVYEDFIRDYEGTVLSILNWLGIDSKNVIVSTPYYEKLADEVNDDRAYRFEKERTERLGKD
jgi:LPS sulfotransferase NodH